MSNDHISEAAKFYSSASTPITSTPGFARVHLVTLLPLTEATGVPGAMAEQHSAPEQAAAGKSHGGLGGAYKVPGREGVPGALGPGPLLVLGVSLLARQPLSRKEPQPFWPAWTTRTCPRPAINSLHGSAPSFLFCVLVCKMELVTRTLPVSMRVLGDAALTLLPDLGPVPGRLWASTAPSLKWGWYPHFSV